AIAERVLAARERQRARLAGSGALCNGEMDGRLTRRHVLLGGGAVQRLLASAGAGALTGRGHDRVLRLARTIADLTGAGSIGRDQIAQALQLRRRDHD
ncbi:MAG TPA: hypothetical protein VIS95_04875, partial [Solirubrobacterales bacterium]